MSHTRKIVLSGLLIATGVVLSAFHIPIAGSKCFPGQHLINVLSAVLLGPFYAVANALIISIIRNMTGLGTILAFPGSMIGALLAGLLHSKFKNHRLTAVGELIGTGIIGGLVAVPIANLLMGRNLGTVVLIIPFMISSLGGSIIAVIIFETISLTGIIREKGMEQ